MSVQVKADDALSVGDMVRHRASWEKAVVLRPCEKEQRTATGTRYELGDYVVSFGLGKITHVYRCEVEKVNK